MSQSLVAKGSITNVAKSGDVAMALMDAKVLVVCDRSGSMVADARSGKASYQLEDEIVARLQAKYPGQVALAAFNDVAWLCPDGVLPMPTGQTNMLDALRLAQPLADAGLKIIMVTDGEPSHSEQEVLDAAKLFRGKLDTIFVGPEVSMGRKFCKALALAAGGTHSDANLKRDPALLEKNLTRLLLAAGK